MTSFLGRYHRSLSQLALPLGNSPVRCVASGREPATSGGAPPKVSSRSRLLNHSSALQWSSAAGGHRMISEYSNYFFRVTKLGESASLAAQHLPRPKLLGGQRWFITPPGHNPRRSRKGYFDGKRFRTVEQATKGAFDTLDDLNPRSLSAFWTRVSQLVDTKYQKESRLEDDLTNLQRQRLMHELNSIFLKTIGEMPKFGPKDLSQTAIGIAKIARAVDCPESQRRLHGAKQILLEVLIGQQSQQKQIIFQSIAKASLPLLSTFDAQGLFNVAYANAIVGCVPKFDDGSTLFDRIAEESIPRLEEFKPQEVSNMVWAFEKAGVSNPRLFEKVGDHIVSLNRLGRFQPQGLSITLLAFAKAGESHPGLFKKFAYDITSRGNLYSFNSQDLSNTVWAFAKAGVKQPRLFQRVADHIVSLDSLHPFDPQALSNTVWAFATAREKQPRLFHRVADHIVALDNLHSFKPQDLSNTIWAFAAAGDKQPRLFQRVADHIVALDNLDGFNNKDCSQLLWGFGAANVPHDELFARVAAHANEFDFETMDEEDRKMLLWAYEKAEAALEKKDDDDS